METAEAARSAAAAITGGRLIIAPEVYQHFIGIAPYRGGTNLE